LFILRELSIGVKKTIIIIIIIILASTHIFYPFAIEAAGTWHEMAIELTQGDWQAYHRKHPGDNFPFLKPVHGFPKRKCGFSPQDMVTE